MPLTELKCKSLKSKEKPYRITDGGGMYLEVMPNGSKYWRLKYRHLGKEKRLALGVYDQVSLAEAREGREKAKNLIKQGIDPSQAKKDQKRDKVLRAENNFEAIAREWHEGRKNRWNSNYANNILSKLEKDVFPYLGSRPIADITPMELLDVIKRIEKRGANEVARRALRISSQIFKYAIITSRAERNPAPDLLDALIDYKKTHYAAITTKELPELLRAIEANDARLYQQTRNALKLIMLTFVRPGELIKAKWSEFDLENALWSKDAENMKMGESHIIPLSKQALKILKEQKEMHGCREWVFPSQVKPIKHMSNNTLLFALYRLGYKGRMTAHGFRALARTAIREELNYDPDVIEKQLSHKTKGALGEAYDRTRFIDQRKIMLQEWADYIDDVALKCAVIKGKFG